MLALTGRTHAVAPESPPPETTDVPGNHPIAAPGAGADMVVLDTAPHAAEAALEAARASDFVLIPCRPATADLAAIGASIDLIRIADTPVAVIINAGAGGQSTHGPGRRHHCRLWRASRPHAGAEFWPLF